MAEKAVRSVTAGARKAAAKTSPEPTKAKTRLFVVIHHGRDAAGDPTLSQIDFPLFSCVRDRLEAALTRAGSPDPEDVEIDLWLDSPGGSAHIAYKLVLLFRSHAGKFTVVVPDYAKSAATLMVLGADEVFMAPAAELGPLDAQVEYEQGGVSLSALDIADSLDQLFATSMQMAIVGGAWVLRSTRLSRKETLANVLDFVAKFMNPIVSQLDPTMIHRSSNQLRVAAEYGDRLLGMRKIEPTQCSDLTQRLVSDYPSHGFVISPQEARDVLGLPVGLVSGYDCWQYADGMFRAFEASETDIVKVFTESEMQQAAEEGDNAQETQ